MSIIICYVIFSVRWTWNFLHNFEPFRLLRLATCAHFVAQFSSMKNFSFFVRISLFCRYISVLFIKILISVAFLCIFSLINSVRQSIKVYNESVSLFLVLVLAFCRLRIFVGSGFVFSDDLSKSLYISQIIKSIKSDVGACLTSSTNPSPTLLFILLFVLVFKIIIFIIFLQKTNFWSVMLL